MTARLARLRRARLLAGGRDYPSTRRAGQSPALRRL